MEWIFVRKNEVAAIFAVRKRSMKPGGKREANAAAGVRHKRISPISPRGD
jgi:hypothetical protein